MNHHVFQIFKEGTQTSKDGQKLYFSEYDLQKTATAYSLRPNAPLVLGHPIDNKPEHGRVHKMFTKDGVLYAQATVSPTLTNLVKQGSYKKVSASFYFPDHPLNPYPSVYYLRHVGFLGAIPPAVKGLTSPEFSEQNEIINFSERYDYNFSDAQNLSSLTRSEQIHQQVLYYQSVCSALSYQEALDHILTFED